MSESTFALLEYHITVALFVSFRFSIRLMMFLLRKIFICSSASAMSRIYGQLCKSVR